MADAFSFAWLLPVRPALRRCGRMTTFFKSLDLNAFEGPFGIYKFITSMLRAMHSSKSFTDTGMDVSDVL